MSAHRRAGLFLGKWWGHAGRHIHETFLIALISVASRVPNLTIFRLQGQGGRLDERGLCSINHVAFIMSEEARHPPKLQVASTGASGKGEHDERA